MDGSLCSPAFLVLTTHQVPQIIQDLPQSVSRLVSKRLEKQMFPSPLSIRNKLGHIKYRSSAFQNKHFVMMDSPVMPWGVSGVGIQTPSIGLDTSRFSHIIL